MKRNLRSVAHFLKMMVFATASLSSTYIWAFSTDSHSIVLLQNDSRIIKGKVVDRNNQPLVGVTVYVQDTAIGTETNEAGLFELETPTNGILVFSYLGYADITHTITSNDFINITLTEDEEGQLDELVITALGIKREEKQLGYSQQKLSGETFTDARSNNWVDNMKGKVPGMTFTSSSSGPMNSTQVVLRGNRSVNTNANGALIVVDGIPINSGMSSSGEGNGYLSSDSPVDFGNGMSDINPEDIESVTVLKCAGATSLYESRVSNGDIM